jgi:hypothetical protein
MQKFSVADPDPGSGAFLNPGFGIRDPGRVKSKDLDPGWKNSDPRSGIWDKHPGSASLRKILQIGLKEATLHAFI